MSGTQNLLPNHLALVLRERNEKELKKWVQRCTTCKLDSKVKPAAVWCTICKEYYCDRCNRIHQEVTAENSSHDVTRISSLRKQSSFPSMSIKKDKELCATHPKEVIKLYCRQCEMALCEVCERENHVGHGYDLLPEAATTHRQEIKALIAPTQIQVTKVNEAIAEWNAYEMEVEKSENEMRENIDEYANELIALVRSWHKQCVNTLQKACEREENLIEDKRGQHERLRTSLETALMYTDRLLVQGKDVHVATVKTAVIDRLQDLSTITASKPGQHISFSFKRTPDVASSSVFGTLSIEQDIKLGNLEGNDQSGQEVTETIAKNNWTASFKVGTLTDRLDPWLTGVSQSLSGDLVLTDHRNNAVKYFDDEGNFKRTVFVGETLIGKKRFTGPSQSLWDCCCLPDGKIVTASIDGLHVFTINGEVVMTLDSDSEFTSVTVSPQSEIIAYNDSKGNVDVYEYPTKKFCRSFKVYEKHSIGWVSKVSIDAQGNIMVCDVNKDSIKIFSINGKLLSEIGKHGKGEGEFIRIRGVACDSDGNLIVVDKGNHRIQKLSPTGIFQKFLLTKTQGLDTPSAVLVDGKNRVVLSTEKGLVHIIRAD